MATTTDTTVPTEAEFQAALAAVKGADEWLTLANRVKAIAAQADKDPTTYVSFGDIGRLWSHTYDALIRLDEIEGYVNEIVAHLPVLSEPQFRHGSSGAGDAS